jgi:type III pantothenate kinase
MLLVADVGNTEMTLGLFDGADLRAYWRLMTAVPRTTDELGLLVRQLLGSRQVDPSAVTGHVVGSVVPGLTRSLADAMRGVTGATVYVVDATSPLPIVLDVDDPSSVGADRILNTLAASARYPGDAIVVDLGTATTFDCIVAPGRFIGGVIAPGIETSAENLIRRAALLGATELVPPHHVIGRRTGEAIRSGVVLGAAAQIDGLVRAIKASWPSPVTPIVVATGGLARAIAPLCTAIDEVAPELTLIGLRLAWEHLGAAIQPAPEKRHPGR